jgi:hypothetical protein
LSSLIASGEAFLLGRPTLRLPSFLDSHTVISPAMPPLLFAARHLAEMTRIRVQYWIPPEDFPGVTLVTLPPVFEGK